MQDTRPSLLIYHVDHAAIVAQVMEMVGPIRIVVVEDSADIISPHTTFDHLLASEPQSTWVPTAHHDPAMILYTSGSTGKPKGAVHSHSAAYHGIDISRQVFDLCPESRVLVGKPISHAGGLETQLVSALLAGGQVTLAVNRTAAEAVAATLSYGITEDAMLASDLLDFVEYLETNPIDLPSLRTTVGSGDSVPVSLHERFRDLFGWEVLEACGMTEIGGDYSANSVHGKRKWGSLGLPAPETELRVIDELGGCRRGVNR